jgi:hypothetical protein
MEGENMNVSREKKSSALWSLLVGLVTIGIGVTVWNAAMAKEPKVSPNADVLAAFDQVRQDIAGLPTLDKGHRTSLTQKLLNAQAAYRRGQPCTAANILGAYLNETRALREGWLVEVAEHLHAIGRLLLHDLLRHPVDGESCPGHERLGKEPVVRLTASDNTHLMGRLSFGAPIMLPVEASGEVFTQVLIPGVGRFSGKPGFPGVPVVHRLVAFPRGAEVTIHTPPPTIAETLQVNLYPFQYQAADQVPPEFADPAFVKDTEAYAADGPFPPEVCTVTPLGHLRDLPIAQVACAAGQYNPRTDTLTLFRAVDFEVRFAGGSGFFLTQAALSPFDPPIGSYAGAVLNKNVVAKYIDPALAERTCLGEELLIFTPPDFLGAAEGLAQWKRDKGILTNVVLVGSAAGDYNVGITSAEAIDQYIEWRYDHCKVRPSYVLLFGDAEWIPTFYMSTTYSTQTGSDYRYAAYPQLPFAIDIWPYFAVGRIPVDNLQAWAVVDKIIKYEKTPPTNLNFYQNVSVISDFQCCRWDTNTGCGLYWKGWEEKGFIATSEFVRDMLQGQGYTVERIYAFGPLDDLYLKTCNPDTTPRKYYSGDPLPQDLGSNSGFQWDGSKQQVVDAFNNGRFLILQRGHGGWNRWPLPEFTKDDVDFYLKNKDLLPVVFSISCSTGLFDNETNPGEYRTLDPDKPYPSTEIPPYGTGPGTENETYFIERMLRKVGGGAVGVIAATRDSPSSANDALTRGLFDAIWPNTIPDFGDKTSKRRLGDILNHAKVYMLTQLGLPQPTEPISGWQGWDELFLFHAIGDPTLEIWTGPVLELSSDFTLEFLEKALRVKYGVEGVTITALQKTRSGLAPIGRATVKNGEAILEYIVLPQPDIPILLSASKANAVGRLLTPQGEPGGHVE